MYLLVGKLIMIEQESKPQSITLKIAGKEYPLKATSPEMEQIMRVAADTINQKLAAYDAKFPDKTLIDKLSFVTLNETIGRLSTQKKYSALEDELKQLQRETGSYLVNIDNK